MDAVKAVGDAKATIEALAARLRAVGYCSAYTDEIEKAKEAWDKEMDRLGAITYTGDDFEPLIKARDPRTIPEFVKMTHGTIAQTAALAAINRTIDPDATIITAAARFQAVCSVCGEQICGAAIMQSMVIHAWAMKLRQHLA